MKSFVRLVLLVLVLLTVALFSALTAMRFAIHGREVAVPKLIGLTPAEAERSISALGLQIMLERQYYSPDITEGKIMSQLPQPDTRVRRGWRVRVAESLGPQRVQIPDVLGESERAAELTIRRRGLDVGAIAQIEMHGPSADQVISQSPPANASGVSAPKISLLVTTAAARQAFVMPNFVGQPLGKVARALQDAGLRLGTVNVSTQAADQSGAATPPLGAVLSPPPSASPTSIIVAQTPAAGKRGPGWSLVHECTGAAAILDIDRSRDWHTPLVGDQLQQPSAFYSFSRLAMHELNAAIRPEDTAQLRHVRLDLRPVAAGNYVALIEPE